MKKGPFKMRGPGVKAADKISKKPASYASKVVKNFKNVPKGFNMIGDKASTTPGYSTTKIAKAKSFSTGSKKILSRAAKASRALRGAGAGLIAELGYRAYKSGQKHSGGKAVKGQKTNALNMRKSIFKK